MEAAASAIAFVQLTASIANLVRLYHELHDIPEDLQDILEHLDLVRPVLCQIKIDFERHPDLASLSCAKQCVEHALAAAAKVNSLAKRLHDRIEKGRKGKRFGIRGKIGLVRANFREDEIEKLQKRLERAVGLVGLCVECYRLAVDQISGDRIIKDTSSMVLSRTQTLVEESEARIIRRVTLELASHQKEQPELTASTKTGGSDSKTQRVGYTVTRSRNQGLKLASYAPSPFGRVVIDSSKATGCWQVLLQTPSWLSREAWTWEFQSQRAVAGWNFSLRSYSVRPQDALIFKAVKSGDVSTMLALFGSGEASLYDRDAGGLSLFHYAAEYEQVDLCRKLLELGLTATIDERPSGRKSRSPLEELVYVHTANNSRNHDRRLLDLLLNHRAEIPSISTRKLFDFPGEWLIEDDYLWSFQEWFMPEYHRLPLLERAEAARRACFSDIQSSNTVLSLLGGHKAREISSENVRECARLGVSVVHSAAIALGRRRAADLAPDANCLKANILTNKYNMNWGTLLYFAVTAASEDVLHGVEVVEPSYDFGTAPWEGPPLASVLGGAICWLRSTRQTSHDSWDRVFQGVVQKWAHEFVDFGLDLAEYGGKEKTVFCAADSGGMFDTDSLCRNESWIRNNCSSAARDAMPVRLTALDVGANPSNWRIWWAPEYEVFARQFWDVVDNPPEVMPGSWFE
ncbi:hypothetical protein LZ32DRAFT_381592 [Colletotrichum eremochloae]|nr:hypothetical protein LZ32DRAFT_381592 [Colletotrichum eremochloae]